MADTALVFRRPATMIHDIELDVTISESHSSSSTVTDHPVEKSVNVVDHVRREPDGLTLEGMVSNTPLARRQLDRIARTPGASLGPPEPTDSPRDALGYAERTYERLMLLMDEGTLITVVTALRTYTNMVLTSLSVPIDGRTGDALKFTATFKQVRVVSNKLTKVNIPARHAKKKAGPKNPKDAAPKQKEQAESYLSQITGVGEVGEGLD